MAEHANRLVMEHNLELWMVLKLAKITIPNHLRIRNSVFTGISFVGDLEDGCTHYDEDFKDVVSLIIVLGGKYVVGRFTLYKNADGVSVAAIEHIHGQ